MRYDYRCKKIIYSITGIFKSVLKLYFHIHLHIFDITEKEKEFWILIRMSHLLFKVLKLEFHPKQLVFQMYPKSQKFQQIRRIYQVSWCFFAYLQSQLFVEWLHTELEWC